MIQTRLTLEILEESDTLTVLSILIWKLLEFLMD